jgi:hypothetical protein
MLQISRFYDPLWWERTEQLNWPVRTSVSSGEIGPVRGETRWGRKKMGERKGWRERMWGPRR